ncbi:hypothetical protein KBB89_02355 [Candidatus Gracilibacteria bacterium]|nr:hypothetical protein [Candidatus Gracilibacteria bacterium]
MIPLDVLDAFGLPHTATPLVGGQGNSWRVGDFVLKPHEESYEGISVIVNQLRPKNFRVSYHHKTKDGNFTYRGWGCTCFELGEEVTGRITEKYAVARELHSLLGTIQKPENWKPSDSPWSQAHEIVWGERELPSDIHPEIYATIEEFFGFVTPLTLPNQIIHGDLCGNILFHETLTPVVIDFSLDYRPREYAEAILIADSIAWENGGEEAYSLLPPDSEQILLRACLFRLITKALLKPQDTQNFRERSGGYITILKKILR